MHQRSTPLLEPALEARLHAILRRRSLLVGLGHPLRGDDAFGLQLAAHLAPRASFPCIEAGPAPENHLGRILAHEPETVVFADAVQLGRPPGHLALFGLAEIARHGLSPHELSVDLSMAYLGEHSTAHMWMLALQPATLDLGAPLSPRVKITLEALTGSLLP